MLPTILDDFLDQEVVDIRGDTVGTLSCYWESANGLLFLGVRIKDQDVVRVVPDHNSRVDDRHSCVRLGFSAKMVSSAPPFDCEKEMKVSLEKASTAHFGLEPIPGHVN